MKLSFDEIVELIHREMYVRNGVMLGEERWEVGEPYQGYGIRGEVIRISAETDKSYTLTVRDEKIGRWM